MCFGGMLPPGIACVGCATECQLAMNANARPQRRQGSRVSYEPMRTVAQEDAHAPLFLSALAFFPGLGNHKLKLWLLALTWDHAKALLQDGARTLRKGEASADYAT